MAKNIKKRSASHIYFGVNKLTGELKHISEVPSGQKVQLHLCSLSATI